MGASLVLQDTSLEVVPGQTLRVKAVVSNTGSVVDAVSLDVVGYEDGWAWVEPEQLRLLPGRKGEVELVVAPPRDSTTAPGPQVLGIRARSSEDPAGSCVEEARLEVLPFVEVKAELVPRSRSARGRRAARFTVAVDNLGNAPLIVGLDAVDPDQNLRLAVGGTELHCPPGSATFGAVMARGQGRYWRGPQLTKDFLTLVSVPGEDAPRELPGTLAHRAVLPQSRALGRAALLAAAVLAMLLLGPSLLSAATGGDKTNDELTAAQQAQQQASDTALEAAADAEAARRAAEEVATRPSPSPSPSPSPAASPLPPPAPFSARLQVADSSTGPFLRVAEDQELSLTGFVLQPNGDRGEMAFLRNGVALVTARLADTQVFDLPSPVTFPPASTVQFTVVCRNPAGASCDAALLLTGTVRQLPPPTSPPEPGRLAPAPAPQPEPRRTAEPLPPDEP